MYSTMRRATEPIAPRRHDAAARCGTDLLETAYILESAAIALAANELTSEQIFRADGLNDALRSCIDDVESVALLAQEFHQALFIACPNTRVLALLQHQRHAESLPPTGDRRGFERIADDHDEILRMIRTGAPRCNLERCLRDHIRRSPLCSLHYGER